MRYTEWFRRKNRGSSAQDSYAQKLLGEEALRAKRGGLFQSTRRVTGPDGAQYVAGVMGGLPFVSVVSGPSSSGKEVKHRIDMLTGFVYLSDADVLTVQAPDVLQYPAGAASIIGSLIIVTDANNAFLRYEIEAQEAGLSAPTMAYSILGAGAMTGLLREYVQAKSGLMMTSDPDIRGVWPAGYDLGVGRPSSLPFNNYFAFTYSALPIGIDSFSVAAVGLCMPTGATKFYLVQVAPDILGPLGPSGVGEAHELVAPRWAAALEAQVLAFYTAYVNGVISPTAAELEYNRQLRHYYFACCSTGPSITTAVAVTGLPSLTHAPTGRLFFFASYKPEVSFVAHGTYATGVLTFDSTVPQINIDFSTVETVDLSYMGNSDTTVSSSVSPPVYLDAYNLSSQVSTAYGGMPYGQYANGYLQSTPVKIASDFMVPSPISYSTVVFSSGMADATYVSSYNGTDVWAGGFANYMSSMPTPYTYGFNTSSTTDATQSYSPAVYMTGAPKPRGYDLSADNYYTDYFANGYKSYDAPVYGFYDATDTFVLVRYSVTSSSTVMPPAGNTYDIGLAVAAMATYPPFNASSVINTGQQFYAGASMPVIMYGYLGIRRSVPNLFGTTAVVSTNPYIGNGAYVFAWDFYGLGYYADAFLAGPGGLGFPPIDVGLYFNMPLPVDPVAHTAYSQAGGYICPYTVYVVTITAGYSIASFSTVANTSLWNVPQRPNAGAYAATPPATSSGVFVPANYVLSAYFTGADYFFPLQMTTQAAPNWLYMSPWHHGDGFTWYIAAEVGAASFVATDPALVVEADYVAADAFGLTGTPFPQVAQYSGGVPVQPPYYANMGYVYSTAAQGPTPSGSTLLTGVYAATVPINVIRSAPAKYLVSCGQANINATTMYISSYSDVPFFVSENYVMSHALGFSADYPQLVDSQSDPNLAPGAIYNTGGSSYIASGPSTPMGAMRVGSGTSHWAPFYPAFPIERVPHDIASATAGVGLKTYTSIARTYKIELFDNVSHNVLYNNTFYTFNGLLQTNTFKGLVPDFAGTAAVIPSTTFFTPSDPAFSTNGALNVPSWFAGDPTQVPKVLFDTFNIPSGSANPGSSSSSSAPLYDLVVKSSGGLYAYLNVDDALRAFTLTQVRTSSQFTFSSAAFTSVTSLPVNPYGSFVGWA